MFNEEDETWRYWDEEDETLQKLQYTQEIVNKYGMDSIGTLDISKRRRETYNDIRASFKSEECVAKILLEEELSFYTQCSDGCKNPLTGNFLFFDFIVEYKEKTYYIEVHGEQHYKENKLYGGLDYLANTMFRDSVKHIFARRHGVYYEIDHSEGNLKYLETRTRQMIKKIKEGEM